MKKLKIYQKVFLLLLSHAVFFETKIKALGRGDVSRK